MQNDTFFNPNDTLINSKSTLVYSNDTSLYSKSTLVNPNDTSVYSKSTFATKNDTSLNSAQCNFCLNTFYNKWNKNKHELICKQRNDQTRLLELKNNIGPRLPDNKTECRYCNKNFCRVSSVNKHFLTCKEKKKYHEQLIQHSNTSNQIVNNNSHNNNCNNNTVNQQNNNNVVLNFGQENLSHIETEKIIDLLREIRKEYGQNQVFLMAGTLIESFDNLIRENPQNRNIVIPSCNSPYASVKTDQGWKTQSVDKTIDRAFKRSAKELYGQKETINDHNERVFKSDTNKMIFNEVKHFSSQGLSGNNPADPDVRQITQSFKANKIPHGPGGVGGGYLVDF